MTRYYYTCPIKAAYMAKEFGVQFQQWLYPLFESNKRELMPQSFKQICEEIQYHFNRDRKYDYDNRYVVSSLSDNIFDYKTGDVLRVCGIGRDYNEDTGIDDIDDNKTPFDIAFDNVIIVGKDEPDYPQILTRSEQKIIMRDNKPFFMPEVEND